MKDIFSEAFVGLQKEIDTEAAMSMSAMFEKGGNDPLSLLRDAPVHRKRRSLLAPPKPKVRTSPLNQGGGFMKAVEEHEAALMRQQTDRIRKTATSEVKMSEKRRRQSTDLTRRRKTKSSWNILMATTDEKNKGVKSNLKEIRDVNKFTGVKCSCGSSDIEIFGNITNRNNDVSKADIWGSKQEDEITTRYRCNNCGKTWNEHD